MSKAVIHPYYVTLQNKQTFSKHVGILCATNNKEVTDKLCVAHVENLKDCHSSFSTQNSRCGLVCLDFSLTQAFQPLTQPPPSPQPCKLWFTIAKTLDFHLCVLLTRVDRNRRPGLTAISQLDLMVRKPAAGICLCFTQQCFYVRSEHTLPTVKFFQFCLRESKPLVFNTNTSPVGITSGTARTASCHRARLAAFPGEVQACPHPLPQATSWKFA